MRKVTVQEWAEALTSGQYTQGQKLLKNNYGEHCCLGVLCSVAGMIYSGDMDAFVDHQHSDIYFGNSEVFGIFEELIADPENLPLTFECDYSAANDAGVKFDTIAKVLLGELDPDVMDISSPIYCEDES